MRRGTSCLVFLFFFLTKPVRNIKVKERLHHSPRLSQLPFLVPALFLAPFPFPSLSLFPPWLSVLLPVWLSPELPLSSWPV